MTTSRLEAFSDGVFAIIITIMVLELHAPATGNLEALLTLWATFASYALSFIYVGIYWSNHHHLLQASQRVNGATLWANLHLLFWLSLIPFATRWMREQDFEAGPVLLYGVVLWMSASAFYILDRTLLRLHGVESLLARAIGPGRKEQVSLVLYTAALPIALWLPIVSVGLFIVVAVMWLIPDRRIEAALRTS
ncbi:MAG: DUF1211 domain-containing protein [Chloroflexi bacterium]|nr:MAG: DUF1211 domain-containing protein [Chloroflexota bacterium]